MSGNAHLLEMRLAVMANDIDLRKHKKSINACIDKYNSAGSKSANFKQLSLIEVNEKRMTVRLTTDEELNTPGKAIRFFSQELYKKIPSLKAAVTVSGQIFRIKEIGTAVPENEDSAIQLKTLKISDGDLICALVQHSLNKTSSVGAAYEKKRRAIEKMKQLALESGLLNL